MTGNMVGAAEAKALGLVNEVTPAETLLPRTAELLQQILKKAPLAVSKIIELVNGAAISAARGFEQEIQDFGELFDTEDAKEGAAAFLEKRQPVFTGK